MSQVRVFYYFIIKLNFIIKLITNTHVMYISYILLLVLFLLLYAQHLKKL